MAIWPLLDSSLGQQGGAVAASSTLTTVTASATAHTKGAWVELIASTTGPSSGLTLLLLGNQASSVDTATLLDLGIGPAGSEVAIAANVQVGFLGPDIPTAVPLPCRVPAGARVSVRIQSAVVSTTIDAQARLSGGGVVPQESTQRATTYGANTATSRGVSLTAPGATNTKSAWTEITAATTAPARFALVTIQGLNQGTSASTGLLDLGVGAPGSEVVLVPNAYFGLTVAERVDYQPVLVPVNIPSGTRLAARYQSTSIAAGAAPAVAVTLFD